jgi:hypothetical protein
MKVYSNNFADLNTLQKNGSVLVSKSNAGCFYKTCIMADVHPKFELSNNKVLFSI